jgi:cytochrome c biogenesis protein
MPKKILRSLSSVKLAIVLLILLASASIVGTLIPQGRGAGQYAAEYGPLAPLVIRLGLTDLYHSVWYIGLLVLFASNTIVCTLTRLPPKWRKVTRPSVTATEETLSALEPRARWSSRSDPGEAENQLVNALENRGYKIRAARDGDRLHILARKRTAGRFGPDIVHAGLLVILSGGILSGLGGFRTELALSEGETVPVPRTSFSLRLDAFTTEYYQNGAVKDWKSVLTVIEGGDPVVTKTVEVNHPLAHKGFSFYQMGYGFEWDRSLFEILVKKKDDPAFRKTVHLKPGERLAVGDGKRTEIRLSRFLPDFVLDDRNVPRTRSLRPNNPAALVEEWRDGTKVFERWVFANFPDFDRTHGAEETGLALELKSLDAPQYSVLEGALDPGVPLIWLGSLLLMGGLGLAFYWPSREIRALVILSRGKAEISAGGVAVKSRDRFVAEFEALVTEVRRTK